MALHIRKALFGCGAILFAALFLVCWARFETTWLAVRTLRLSDTPVCRLVFIADLHYKGDIAYLHKVVDRSNNLKPDFVCFGGDIVEDRRYLAEALALLSTIEAPLYGVPGNHDHYDPDVTGISRAFQETNGKWLKNKGDTASWNNLVVIHGGFADTRAADRKDIVLIHYPADAAAQQHKWDLVLAGHSHGGQIRLPFWGALVLPQRVGPYDRGFFDSPAGPLYANPGIGTWMHNFRLFCRPEITVIEI